MKNRINILQKGYRFILVGAFSTTINYSIFSLLYKVMSIYYIFSSVVGYLTGLSVGYLLNKNWTYIAQIDKSKSYIYSYMFVYFISLLLSQWLLFSLVQFLGINPLYANVAAIGLSTLLNFFGTNFFVFRKAETSYAK